MSANIVPVEINDHNSAPEARLLSFDFISKSILLEDPSDYEVMIEKMKVPLDNVPISNNANWSIVFESRDKEIHPSTIPPGDFKRTILSIEVKSISEFCLLFNKHLLDNLTSEFCFGSMSYSTETGLLTWEENNNVNKKRYVNIWLDSRLSRLFSSLPLLSSLDIRGEKYYALAGSKLDVSAMYSQSNSTARLFYSIVSFRCRTNLPTAKYFLSNNERGTTEESDLLTTIDFIDTEMIDNHVVYYHPSSFRHYSLIPSLPVTGFKLRFTVYYADGQEKDIYLHQNEHASISLKFEKK